MRHSHLQRWFWLHKWSSLVCTVFLVSQCLTGLPLVFHDEIADWNTLDVEPAAAMTSPVLSLDTVVTIAHQRYPADRIASIFVDDDEPRTTVALESPPPGPGRQHTLVLESRTGAVLNDSRAPIPPRQRFHWISRLMATLLTVHTSLFAGLPGRLFLGLMALLFVVAIITGVVLYRPFMRKLDFGTLRRNRSRRLLWLDLHNLVGIGTLAWVMVVGVTGLFNELSTPLTGLWQLTEIPRLLAPYRSKPMPTAAEMVSPQTAMDSARQAMPGMTMRYIAYPGQVFGTSPQHFVIFARGSIPLTFELIVPVLVDARTGRVERTVQLPWYLKALELSRPLHFGDYGGLPLKILWGTLDLYALAVLLSGLYLWLARHRQQAARLEHRALSAPSGGTA